MLRIIFVFIIIVVGVAYAVQGPFYALLFYLWNAYFRPEQWVWGNTIAVLNLSFAIGLYLVVVTVFSGPKLKLNLRTGLVVLFFLQTVLSVLFSEHWLVSWNYAVEFWKVLLVTYLIVVLVNTEQRFRLTLLVIALSLGFECAKQGWAQLVLNPGGQNNNPIPFLGDNNGVAVGTMMLVPLFGALANTADRTWEKYLHRFFGLGVFMRGFTTYSRGGFLAATALALVTLARSERKVRALLAMTIVAILVVNVMPRVFWDRMQTITAPEGQRDDSAASRVHFWRVAVDMAQRKPLTGVGLNAFSQSYEDYNREGEFGGVRAVHSVWFGVLAEMGFPGLALFLTILVLAMSSCWRVSHVARKQPQLRAFRLYADALLTSLIVYSVAGTFLAVQYNEMYWHFVGLTTALAIVSRAAAQVENVAAADLAARPKKALAG